MRNFLIALLIFIAWSFIGMWCYYTISKDVPEQKTEQKRIKETTKINVSKTINTTDNIPNNINTKKKNQNKNDIENKILYSHFNTRVFKADSTLQIYAYELKDYLLKYPLKTVTITGHTDNVGLDSVNVIVARDRATNVKRYLISTGIPEEKLTVHSEGETKPIADNITKEGRTKNRRIELKIN